MRPAILQLGPFTLESFLDRGGMGEIWLGRHVPRDMPVAIKVLTGRHARAPERVRDFRREVQAVARLNHPNIIMLLDRGSLPDDADARSDGRLANGSPYLVMEYADRGALDDPLGWPELRATLMTLLGALGHAHARGLVHRDLKPANVLRFSAATARPGLKLSDFGLAHMSRAEQDHPLEALASTAGTPRYMAPEQFRGQWRDYGPWTDLYALGIIAWRLVSGDEPFDGPRIGDFALQHTRSPLPRLDPRIDVPDGLDAWIARLCAKRPDQRFQRARDAAWALEKLAAPRRSTFLPPWSLPPRFTPWTTPPPAAYKSPSDEVGSPPDDAHPSTLTSPRTVTAQPAEAPATDVAAPTPRDDTAQDGVAVVESGAPTSAALGELDTAPGGPPSFGELDTALATREATPVDLSFGRLTYVPRRDEPLQPSTDRAAVEAQRRVLEDVFGLQDLALQPEQPTPKPAQQMAPIEAPPFPTEVPRSSVGPNPTASAQLMGAGLGLYELRDVPLVDREPQREALWGALRRVHQGGAPVALVLRGRSGYGKSRLARWLCESAHGHGVATVLRAHHSPTGEPEHGLRGMLAEALQCHTLAPGQVLERARARLTRQGVRDPYEWRALTSLILGSRSQKALLLNEPSARRRIVLRHLERLGRERPVIVWLDDAQWGHDSVALARQALDPSAEAPPRALFLLTVNDDALESRPGESQALDQLLTMEGATTVQVGPLSSRDSAALVGRLLGLSGRLAHQVEAHMHGNPMFAVRLIGDWVQRGLLEPSDDGFVLKAGAQVVLPEDLHEVWRRPIQRILARFPHALPVLELAAALGLELREDDLLDACRFAALTLPEGLFEALEQSDMLHATANGWAFAHTMLVSSLKRLSIDADRWAALNLACVRMLETRQPPAPEHTLRMARHLLAAERYERALAPLLDVATDALVRGAFDQAHRALKDREHALTALAIPEGALPWIEGWLCRAELYRLSWEMEPAERWARRSAEAARGRDLPAQLATAQRLLFHVERQRGDFAEASRLNQEALDTFTALGEQELAASCLLNAALLARHQKRHEEAIALYQQALDGFVSTGDRNRQARCLYGLGNVHREREDHTLALDRYAAAADLFKELGNLNEYSHCLNGVADIDRYQGRLDAAEDRYREALRVSQLLGSRSSTVTLLNLALLYLDQEAFEQAHQEVLRGMWLAERRRQRPLTAYAHTLMLPCAAHQGDLPAFTHHFTQANALLKEFGIVDPDIARQAERAGRLLLDAGHQELASLPLQLALDHWTRLDATEKAHHVRELLDRLTHDESRV